ncbi:MAG: flavodoxin-dependent (E)-4-hydroxy-3-methylbut-2-enyl-diphosphate synthase, partial [Firmicutes bacterium]|nr:flavodoxin-dependent (E)-4-hydroxy-3-methylbut-2-enyl-diphosphate synthase [Bacillota bacterium]
MSKQVKVGNVLIGGGAPVSVQTMATESGAGLFEQLLRIKAADCDIVRVAVNSIEDAAAIAGLKDAGMPVVADIQYDYKLAIAAVEGGADKIRVNPGNIGGAARLRAVADCARTHGVPIRAGVNSGSIPRDIYNRHGRSAESLCLAAIESVKTLEKAGFRDIVVSVKSSSAAETVKANRLLAREIDYPLHLGVTEAGTLKNAAIKSAVAFGALLLDGVGDTVRVSATGAPEDEVAAGIAILEAAGLRKRGCEIISCPMCARCKIDLSAIAVSVEQATARVTAGVKIAVMGCAVNGPGEAKGADYC